MPAASLDWAPLSGRLFRRCGVACGRFGRGITAERRPQRAWPGRGPFIGSRGIEQRGEERMKSNWCGPWGDCRERVVACLLAACASGWSSALRGPTIRRPRPNRPRPRSGNIARRCVQNRGVYDLAADEWESFLKNHAKDPLAAKARHYLGVCKLQIKKFDEAAAAFATALKGSAKFRPGRRRAISISGWPTQLRARRQSRRLRQSGRGVPHAARKISQGQRGRQGARFAGRCLLRPGQKDEAAKAYADALQRESIGPLKPDAQYALGVVLEESGKAAEAAAVYDQFLKDHKEHQWRAEVILRRGNLYFAAKDYANAASWFASAAAAKDFALADRALSRQAEVCTNRKSSPRLRRCLPRCRASFRKSEYAGKAALFAGSCYYQAGNLDEAAKWLTQGLAAGGETGAEVGALARQDPAEAEEVRRRGQDGRASAALGRREPAGRQPDVRSGRGALRAGQQAERGRGRVPGRRAKYPQHAVAPQALIPGEFHFAGTGRQRRRWPRPKHS